MFRLTKILGGRINVPEPATVTVSSAVTVADGTPVRITGGTLTKLTSSTTVLATHVTLASVTSGKKVLCAPVTPDMIFAVPLAAAPTGMTVGTEYLIGTDSQTVTASTPAANASTRGVILVDLAGAKAAGDEVLVRFPAV